MFFIGHLKGRIFYFQLYCRPEGESFKTKRWRDVNVTSTLVNVCKTLTNVDASRRPPYLSKSARRWRLKAYLSKAKTLMWRQRFQKHTPGILLVNVSPLSCVYLVLCCVLCCHRKRKRTEPEFLVAFKSEDVIWTTFKQRFSNFLTTFEQHLNAFKCCSNYLFRFKWD